jgi:aldehyde dehydrogenase (NAD+)
MGGKNPVIVLEDADVDLAVAGVAGGAFGSTGQRCTATSRVILMHPVADAFLEKLVGIAGKMRLGDPLADGIDMGPSVDDSQLQTVLSYLEIGKAEGAELLCGGARASGGALSKGYFVPPTIFDRVRPEMRIAQEEIFGPVLSVIPFDDDDDAVRIANNSRYGLSGAVNSGSLERAMAVARRVRTGTLAVNGGQWFAPDSPFGGYKESGLGREHGVEGFEEYLETKTIGLPV